MTAEQLRAAQAPFKDRYRSDAQAGLATLSASGRLRVDELQCEVDTRAGHPLVAGVHPLAGGDGVGVCAGDMLLQALVACAGVTLSAVATAMGLDVRGGTLTADGDMDFRGTLGVDRAAPVGFTAIRLTAVVDSTADDAQLEKLAQLTERYCVVAQSLRPPIAVRIRRSES